MLSLRAQPFGLKEKLLQNKTERDRGTVLLSRDELNKKVKQIKRQ